MDTNRISKYLNDLAGTPAPAPKPAAAPPKATYAVVGVFADGKGPLCMSHTMCATHMEALSAANEFFTSTHLFRADLSAKYGIPMEKLEKAVVSLTIIQITAETDINKMIQDFNQNIDSNGGFSVDGGDFTPPGDWDKD